LGKSEEIDQAFSYTWQQHRQHPKLRLSLRTSGGRRRRLRSGGSCDSDPGGLFLGGQGARGRCLSDSGNCDGVC